MSTSSAQNSTYNSRPDAPQLAAVMVSNDDTQRSSGRSSSGRSKKDAQSQLTTIEKSVTHLLVATKQLLETLTKWSRGAATEAEVSDVYVRLGYEFNIACRAFNAIKVDTADLGPVPDLLREILEETLSQEASQQSLDRYLPGIRDIIIKLLQGLKKKQQKLRQKTGSSSEGDKLPRQSSTASSASVDANLTQQLEDLPSRASSSRSFAERVGSGDTGTGIPPRSTSIPQRESPRRQKSGSQNGLLRQTGDLPGSDPSSSTMQNIPVIAPYPENDTMPTGHPVEHELPAEPEPPRPPPKQSDALTALQRGGDLERRASRRFSAYQIQKHLGPSVNGIGAIPPAQHSPLPNRGRDVRESLNAVRSRRSMLQNRSRTRADGQTYEHSPSSLHKEVKRVTETSDHEVQQESAPSTDAPDSPIMKTPEDKLAAYPFSDTRSAKQQDNMGATLNGPMQELYAPSETILPESSLAEVKHQPPVPARHGSRQGRMITPPSSQFIPDGSPQPGKELTLFLQYKSKIKKFVLPDGGDLTIARLQLAFIEKFAWNTHNNGVDLPDIYIQDPVSGVRHELESLSDIRERSVLVLNVEALDEVKRHIDDGIGGLRRVIEGIRSSVDQQQTTIRLVSDRQQEAAKEMAALAASPLRAAPAPAVSSTPAPLRPIPIKDKAGQLKEVQTLRRDLNMVRQTYTSFVSDINASMGTIRSKAASVRTAAQNAPIPDMDSNTGRTYVNHGKKSLSDDSEKIVNRVDDLQDIVEDLRKDVVTRGVRPLPRQLEDVGKDISHATTELKKLQEFLKREKPIWTKIWEKELQVVCDDRDLLTMQEDLAADLEDDLDKAAATFALVEEATKQQNLQNPREAGSNQRIPSRTFPHPLAESQGADPEQARTNVLTEVRALLPDHESRLDAIDRASRARQRELVNRLDTPFKKQLRENANGVKLKQTGGVEAVEKRREIRIAEEQKKIEEKAEAARRAGNPELSSSLPPADAVTASPVDGDQRGEPDGRGLTAPLRGSRERETSPEPVFVEARESVGAPIEDN